MLDSWGMVQAQKTIISAAITKGTPTWAKILLWSFLKVQVFQLSSTWHFLQLPVPATTWLMAREEDSPFATTASMRSVLVFLFQLECFLWHWFLNLHCYITLTASNPELEKKLEKKQSRTKIHGNYLLC